VGASAEPDDDALGLRVDGAHLVDLGCLFGGVGLVDADCVDPEGDGCVASGYVHVVLDSEEGVEEGG